MVSFCYTILSIPFMGYYVMHAYEYPVKRVTFNSLYGIQTINDKSKEAISILSIPFMGYTNEM